MEESDVVHQNHVPAELCDGVLNGLEEPGLYLALFDQQSAADVHQFAPVGAFHIL